MALKHVISEDLASKLSELTVEEISCLVKASSLGLKPSQLHAGIQALAEGSEYELSAAGGAPRPIVIQAWSFVRDRGQYHDTYGLTSAKAGELSDLLRTDREKGVAEITAVVTAALRKKGSAKPVTVSTLGLPGIPTAESGMASTTGANHDALKEEIKRSPAEYGLYKFTVEDTGRSGGQRFRVRLGGGLYAIHASKRGAVDVARITRKHGRTHELVAGNVALWIDGKSPLIGADIPTKISFTGQLLANQPLPADPVAKDKTVAESSH